MDKAASNFENYKQAAVVSTYLTGDYIDTRDHERIEDVSDSSMTLIVLLIVGALVILIVVFLFFKLRRKPHMLLEHNKTMEGFDEVNIPEKIPKDSDANRKQMDEIA